MIDKNKIIDEAIHHFNNLKPAVSKPKLRPVKMTINGQTVVLSSGKAVWKRIGDAKNALRNEFDNFWHTYKRKINKPYGYLPGHDYKTEDVLKEEVYQFVLTNVIRFEDA